jgi:hypothetical protein
VAAIGAHIDEDVGHDESRARELDGTQCEAGSDEFVAPATSIGDVIADFRMCKHGFFSATGSTTRDRVVMGLYGTAALEDSPSERRRAL